MQITPLDGTLLLLRQISSRVARLYQEQRKKTLLVVDESHLLEDGLLEDLRLLTNYQMDTLDPLVVVLVGHPSLRLRLQRPVHQALWDRVRMAYRLKGRPIYPTMPMCNRERYLVSKGGLS